MKLVFTPEAEEALFEIALWVEQQNTRGSGDRFVNRFIERVSAYARPNVFYAICKNKALAALGYSCISIDDWVIVFTVTKKEFILHYILLGSALK